MKKSDCRYITIEPDGEDNPGPEYHRELAERGKNTRSKTQKRDHDIGINDQRLYDDIYNIHITKKTRDRLNKYGPRNDAFDTKISYLLDFANKYQKEYSKKTDLIVMQYENGYKQGYNTSLNTSRDESKKSNQHTNAKYDENKHLRDFKAETIRLEGLKEQFRQKHKKLAAQSLKNQNKNEELGRLWRDYMRQNGF